MSSCVDAEVKRDVDAPVRRALRLMHYGGYELTLELSATRASARTALMAVRSSAHTVAQLCRAHPRARLFELDRVVAEFYRRLAERGANVDVRDGHEECLIHLLAPQRVEQNAFDQAQSLVALKGLADEQEARLHAYTSWRERLQYDC